MVFSPALTVNITKKAVSPGSGDGPGNIPVWVPSSEPANPGKDAKNVYDYVSYDDGQKSISKGMSSKSRAWRAHAQPVLQMSSLLRRVSQSLTGHIIFCQ